MGGTEQEETLLVHLPHGTLATDPEAHLRQPLLVLVAVLGAVRGSSPPAWPLLCLSHGDQAPSGFVHFWARCPLLGKAGRALIAAGTGACFASAKNLHHCRLWPLGFCVVMMCLFLRDILNGRGPQQKRCHHHTPQGKRWRYGMPHLAWCVPGDAATPWWSEPLISSRVWRW